MPTPHGSRGGMAFSADELRVLRRALAEALSHSYRRPPAVLPGPGREPGRAHAYAGLARALDEALAEASRLRAFRAAEVARYRAALPGAATGYLARLAEALDDGWPPAAEDVAAVRCLAAAPCAPGEAARRAALRRRLERLAPAERHRVPSPPGASD